MYPRYRKANEFSYSLVFHGGSLLSKIGSVHSFVTTLRFWLEPYCPVMMEFKIERQITNLGRLVCINACTGEITVH